jgi:hypothetical protein
MERSLHGSLANVESLARKGLLSPTQALSLQVQELAGLVQFHATTVTSELQQLIEASRHLWVSVEALLKSIVQYSAICVVGCVALDLKLKPAEQPPNQSNAKMPRSGASHKPFWNVC